MNKTNTSRVRQLLPDYLNKTLTSGDQAFMDTWMREQLSQHPELQDEMRWLELTRAQIREIPPKVSEEAGWHELQARISAAPRVVASQAAPPFDWLQSLKRLWVRPVMAYAVAAVFLMQSAALWWVAVPGGDVRPMSATTGAGPTEAGVVLQVVFKDQAQVAQVRQALAAAQASVVEGPSALGVWRIKVPADQAAAVLTALQNHAAVQHAVMAP